MQWSPGIGPHFPVKLVAIATRLEAMSLSRALPNVLAATRPWSALGPHDIGNRWSSAGTSGHDRRVRMAGHRPSTATTSDGEAAWHRVRILPDGCRGPATLANGAGVTEHGPHAAAELVPSLPGPSHVHTHRPCPERALSIGRQRSFTDNKSRCVFPPSCRIAPYGAVQEASQARGSPGGAWLGGWAGRPRPVAHDGNRP
jgi:hypothetical protein